MVGPGEVAAVGGLHGRDDAELGEAVQGVVGHRLDVLDPVPDRAAPGGECLLDGVQGVPYGSVTDGVGGGGNPGAVELADDPGVGIGVGPEGVRGLAVTVRVFQPGGAVVDGAVHEELDAFGAPEPAARALLPDERAQGVGAGAGLAPGSDPQP